MTENGFSVIYALGTWPSVICMKLNSLAPRERAVLLFRPHLTEEG